MPCNDLNVRFTCNKQRELRKSKSKVTESKCPVVSNLFAAQLLVKDVCFMSTDKINMSFNSRLRTVVALGPYAAAATVTYIIDCYAEVGF